MPAAIRHRDRVTPETQVTRINRAADRNRAADKRKAGDDSRTQVPEPGDQSRAVRSVDGPPALEQGAPAEAASPSGHECVRQRLLHQPGQHWSFGDGKSILTMLHGRACASRATGRRLKAQGSNPPNRPQEGRAPPRSSPYSACSPPRCGVGQLSVEPLRSAHPASAMTSTPANQPRPRSRSVAVIIIRPFQSARLLAVLLHRADPDLKAAVQRPSRASRRPSGLSGAGQYGLLRCTPYSSPIRAASVYISR